MSWYLVLQIALTIGLLVLIGFVVAAMAQLSKTLRTLNDLLNNINRELPPVLIKVQTTLDGVNSELDRVEEIVSAVQEVSSRVQNTTNLVQNAVASPVIRLAGVWSGAKTAVASFFAGRKSSGKPSE